MAVCFESSALAVAGIDAKTPPACNHHPDAGEVTVPRPLDPQSTPRITPNLFGISFGLAGLAQSWSVASRLAHTPAWPADALWSVVAVTWLVTLVAYIAFIFRAHRASADFEDATFGPFTVLVPVVGMLLGVALAGHARSAGMGLFVGALVGTVLVGAWLTGGWILSDTTLLQWHPGYFLPNVAGGLLAAGGAASLGYPVLAKLMFGYGAISWAVLGPIVLGRLFIEQHLPNALLPTIAIAQAPPLVAGSAWFQINHGRPDTIALLLSGFAVLMMLIQLRLIPTYRRVPFGPAWWALSFSYAAAFALAIRWLAAEQVANQQAWTYALLAGVTLFIGALALRTVGALRRGDFLPRSAQAGGSPPRRHVVQLWCNGGPSQ